MNINNSQKLILLALEQGVQVTKDVSHGNSDSTYASEMGGMNVTKSMIKGLICRGLIDQEHFIDNLQIRKLRFYLTEAGSRFINGGESSEQI